MAGASGSPGRRADADTAVGAPGPPAEGERPAAASAVGTDRSPDLGRRDATPWYREASILISIVALLVSGAASYYTSAQSARQYEFGARAELGQLVQRLSALPKENTDLLAQYADRPETSAALSGLINQENLVLAHQAADVIEQIPDRVSAVECLAVANALATSEQFPRSLGLIDRGLGSADDPTTREALLRLEGRVHFDTGELWRGRAALQEALEVWRGRPVWEQARGYALTELLWSSLEQAAGECEEAAAHLARAREQAARLDPATGVGRQVVDAVQHTEVHCA